MFSQVSNEKGNIIFKLNRKRLATLSFLGVNYSGCLLPFEASSSIYSNAAGAGLVLVTPLTFADFLIYASLQNTISDSFLFTTCICFIFYHNQQNI